MLHSWLFLFLSAHRYLGYGIIFFAMIFEGDIALFTIGFLTRARYFDPGDVFIYAAVGTWTGDLLWYSLGYSLIKRFPRLASKAESIGRAVDSHIQKRLWRTLLVSKFTYGLHHLILMRVGSLKLPLFKYIKADFVASIIWILVIGGIGYFAGASFQIFKHYLKYTELALLLALVIFVVVDKSLAKIFKNKL